MEKSCAEVDYSSFGPLPDDIVLAIFNNLIDLETLCSCKLVSKRFYRIILQVDTISYITKPNISLNPFLSAIRCLSKFRGLKSLCIQIPPSRDYGYLFKWKTKFGNKLDSLIYLSPLSVYHNKESYVNENGNEVEEDIDKMYGWKYINAKSCLRDAMRRHYMLMCCIKNFPLLEEVSFMCSDKRWRYSVTRGKLAEIRKGLTSFFETASKTNYKFCHSRSEVYVPLLELPISGYVMKGVTLFSYKSDDLPDGSDSYMKSDAGDFDNKEEAVYNEAITEIFKNHMGRAERMDRVTFQADMSLFKD